MSADVKTKKRGITRRLLAMLLSLAMMAGLVPATMLTVSAAANPLITQALPWLIIDDYGPSGSYIKFHIDSSLKTDDAYIWVDRTNTVERLRNEIVMAGSYYFKDWDETVNGKQQVRGMTRWNNDVIRGEYYGGDDGYPDQNYQNPRNGADQVSWKFPQSWGDMYFTMWVGEGTEVRIGTSDVYANCTTLTVAGPKVGTMANNTALWCGGVPQWDAEYILQTTGWKNGSGSDRGIVLYEGEDANKLIPELNSLLSHWPHGNGLHNGTADACVTVTDMRPGTPSDGLIDIEYDVKIGDIDCFFFGRGTTATGKMRVQVLPAPNVSCNEGYVRLSGGTKADYYTIDDLTAGRSYTARTNEDVYVGFGHQIKVTSHMESRKASLVVPVSSYSADFVDKNADGNTAYTPKKEYALTYVLKNDIDGVDLSTFTDDVLAGKGEPEAEETALSGTDAETYGSKVYKQTINYDENVKLPQAANPGTHTFLGWALKPDAVAVYQPGIDYVNLFGGKGENKLYARYSTPKVNVTLYKDKSDTVELVSTTVDAGTNLSSYPLVTKSGYNLDGWYEIGADADNDADDVKMADQYGFPIAAGRFTKTDNTVYAKWTPNSVTVKYDTGAKDAVKEGVVPDQTVTYEDPANGIKDENLVKFNTQNGTKNGDVAFTRDGYEFIGWSRFPGASVAEFVPADDANDEDQKKDADLNVLAEGANGTDVTLYAVWQKLSSVKLTFDGGDRKDDKKLVKPAAQVVEGGVSVNADTLPAASCDGYTFNGWVYYADDDAGHENPINVNGEKFTSDTTLYATWTANKYFVQYNLNMQGGSEMSNLGNNVADAAQLDNAADGKLKLKKQVRTGSDGKTSADGVYRTGHTLKSWNTDPNGDGISFAVYDQNTPADKVPTFPAEYLTADDGEGESEINTLYAIWEPTEYTVHFIGMPYSDTDTENAPVLDYDEKKVAYNSKYGVMPAASRNGYSFAGWYLGSSEGVCMDENGNDVSYTPGSIPSELVKKVPADVMNFADDVYLIAMWLPKGSTTVKLIANDNLNPTRTISVEKGDKYYDKGVWDLVREGYEFDGWYHAKTDNNGDEIQVDGSYVIDESKRVSETETVSESKTHTLVAKWTPNTYKITYHLNEKPVDAVMQHTDEFGNPSLKYDNEYKLRTNVFYKEGYIFKGWASSEAYANAGIVNYPEGATVKNLTAEKNVEVHLYAVWEAEQYTVTLHPENGESDRVIYVKVGDKYTLPANLTKPGYIFDGWHSLPQDDNDPSVTPDPYASPDPDAPGDEVYDSDTDVTKNGAKDLYAHWIPKTYTIDYDKNGAEGTEELDAATGEYSKAGTVTMPAADDVKAKYTYAGKKFIGWAKSADAANAGTVNFGAGAEVKLNSLLDDLTADDLRTTLYAVWADNTNLVITLDKNMNDTGTEVELSSDTLIRNSNSPYNLPVPSCPGYQFDGWYTEAEGGDEVKSTDLVLLGEGEGQTLFAHWTAYTYKLTLNGNEGTFDDPTGFTNGVKDDVKYTDTITLPTPVRTGYEFSGWKLVSDTAADTMYSGGAKVSKIAGSNGNGEEVTLVAQWGTDKHTVTYMSNGLPYKIVTVSDNKILDEPDAPSRDGYTFGGWYKDEACENTWNFDTDKVIADTTLYAKWTAAEYTIKYNTDGGFPEPIDKTKQHDVALTLAAAPIKAGFNFAGWKSSEDNAVYGANAQYTKNASATFTAQWDADTYTVFYDANGGTGAPTAQTKTHDTDLTLSSTEPTRAGYTFLGWAESASATEKQYDKSGTFTKNETVTLFAVWSGNKYTIEFNGNGAEGGSTAAIENVPYGEEVTLTANGFTKDGVNFAGWAISEANANAQIVKYGDGETVKDLATDGTVTLYAVWMTNGHTVTYMSNGLVYKIAAAGHNTKAIAPDEPSREGYEFGGWYKDKDYTDEWVFDTDVVDGDTTLYAKWTAKTYTIEFNGNGADGGSTAAIENVPYGEEVTLTANGFTKDGANFAGWAISEANANAQIVKYGDGETVKDLATDGTVTLYAVWMTNGHTVTYMSNGLVYKIAAAGHNTKAIAPDEPSREGYEFGGWYKDKGCTDEWVFDTDVVDGDTTLYAKWIAKTYTIEFNGNGADGGSTAAIENVPYGEEVTLTTNGFTKNGANFAGWAISEANANAQIVKYGDGETVKDLATDGTVTLYAVWMTNGHTVTYMSNGLVYKIAAAGHNTKAIAPDEPSREGYEFGGWYKDKGCTDEWVFDTDVVDGDTTLYAKWTAKTYTIEFNGNGADGGSTAAIENVPYGEEVTLTANGFTKNGANFAGWATSEFNANAQIVKYGDGETVKDLATDGTVTLYAVWVRNGHAVTYMSNETVYKILTVSHNAAATAPDEPSREGYTFGGWYKDKGCTDEWVFDTDVVDGDTTLYAKWTADTYNVTYNAGGGSPVPSAQTKTHDIALTLADAPTKAGFNFAGWKSSEDGAVYGANAQYTKNASATFTAQWSADTYMVFYDANGGVGAPTAQTKTHGEDLTLTDNVPTRAGYTFAGWAESANATAKKYSRGGTFTDNKTVTLFAVWTGNNYTIEFNGNGADGGSTAAMKNVKYGEEVTLTKNGFTKDGADFAGWATSEANANAQIVKYSDGEKVTDLAAGGTVTLYAVWVTNGHTVTYMSNGSVYEIATVGHNTKAAAPDEPSREGYEFGGWYKDKDYTDEWAFDTDVVDGDTTLYAKWTAKTYTITYNAGYDGAAEITSGEKTHDQSYTINAAPMRDGYNFTGWLGSDGAVYGAKSTYTANADITLTAQWSRDTYSVIYDANGGKGAPSAVTKSTDEDAELEFANVPTRTGYEFLGWDTNVDAENASYTQTGTTTYEGKTTVTMYAVWKANTYEITYNTDGGSPEPASQEKTHDIALTLAAAPIKAGFNFAGWKSSEDNAVYGANAQYIKNASAEFTAQWSADTYMVFYDANGGTGAPTAQTKTHGEDLTLTNEVPRRTGYTFAGWAESANATAKKYDKGGTYTTDATVTLFAVWSGNKYTIEFNGNGADGGSMDAMKNVKYGKEVALTKNSFTKSGTNFAGWATSEANANAQIVKFGDGEQVKDLATSGTVTLYAVWMTDGHTHTVTYMSNEMVYKILTVSNDTKVTAPDEPSREGYTFGGWYKDEAYENEWDFDTDKVTGDTTLYAKWTADTYNVTYNTDGGSPELASQEKTHDIALTLADAPTKAGYNFVGWKSSEDGAVYGANAQYTKNASAEFTAQWSEDTYMVFYDANGGVGAPTAQTKTHGEDLTLSDDVPTRVGYTFAGWAESADETEAVYQSGDTFSKNETVTLFAVWNAKEYTITFNGNGADEGTSTAAMENVKYGEEVMLTTNGFTKNGSRFIGWAVSEKNANNGVVAYGDESSVKNLATGEEGDSEVTLYAVWSSSAHVITLHLNDTPEAPAAVAQSAYNFNTGAEINALAVPTREGYTFEGWYSDEACSDENKVTEADGKGIMVDGSVITVPGDGSLDDLYAKWTVKTYKITEVTEQNGTKVGDIIYTEDTAKLRNADKTFDYGIEVAFTVDSQKYGLENDAVTVEIDGQKTNAEDGVYKFTITKDTTVTLSSNAIQGGYHYTVTYHANGGDGSDITKELVSTESVTLNDGSAYTRDGYSFIGWSTSSDGAAMYRPGETLSRPLDGAALGRNIDLYAVWTNDDIWVTLNDPMGVCNVYMITIKQGGTYANLPELLTKEGYTFGGWYLSEAYAEKDRVDRYTHAVSDTNHTLYAKWTVNKYTVKVNDSSLAQITGVTNGAEYEYGTKVTFTVKPTAGNTLDKLQVMANDKELTPDKDGKCSFEITEDTTLYVNYAGSDPEVQYYTIKYETDGVIADQRAAIGKETYLRDGANLTKDGSKLVGWSKTENGEKDYDLGEKITDALAEAGGEITLYPVWEDAAGITVTFVYGGGTESSGKTREYKPGDVYGSLPATEKEGCTFGGWFLKGTDGKYTTRIYPDMKLQSESSHTLYAKWTQEKTTANADGSTTETKTDSEYGDNDEVTRTTETTTNKDKNGNETGKTVKETEYDKDGNPAKETEVTKDKDGNTTGSTEKETEYDKDGNKIKETETSYDKNGNPASKTETTYTTNPSTGKTTSTTKKYKPDGKGGWTEVGGGSGGSGSGGKSGGSGSGSSSGGKSSSTGSGKSSGSSGVIAGQGEGTSAGTDNGAGNGTGNGTGTGTDEFNNGYTLCPKDNTCVENKFNDLDPKAWYHDGIHFCIENGLMSGFTDGTFRPDGYLTRAMIVAMLWRLDGANIVDGPNNFSDVAEDAWYYDEIVWASKNDVVRGYGDGTFGPEDLVTREQLTMMFKKYAAYKGIDVSTVGDLDMFVDKASISDWATGSVAWAVGENLIVGKPGHIFDPQGHSTRAETATIMMKYCTEIAAK